MKSSTNPFQFGVAIQDPIAFVGRKQLVEEIIQAMANPEPRNISLHGERRTGKTSLLKYLEHSETVSARGLPENHVVVYFNFQKYSHVSKSEVWTAIANEVAKKIKQDIPEGQVETKIDTITQSIKSSKSHSAFGEVFGEAFTHLKSSGITIHLLFDEFEYTESNPELKTPFYNVLRSLTTDTTNISYIIATRIGLKVLQPGEGSPFFNIFTTRILPPFKEEEVCQLIFGYISRSGLSISLAEKLYDELPFLYDQTGYHPFFLQALCYHLFTGLDKPDWPLGQARKEAIQAFEKDSEEQFEYYRDHSSEKEQEVIGKLATRQVIDWDDLGYAASSLRDRCLIIQAKSDEKKQDKQPTAWRLFSSSFAKWVIKQKFSFIDDLQQEWNLLSKKFSTLKVDRIRTKEKFCSGQLIAETEAKHQRVEQQLKSLENQISQAVMTTGKTGGLKL